MAKKIISLFLIVALASSCILCVNAESDVPVQSEMLLGDVNRDGQVNATDSRLILLFSIGAVTLDEEALKTAKVTRGSSLPNSIDSVLVLKRSVGNTDLFPAEYLTVEFEKWTGLTEKNYYSEFYQEDDYVYGPTEFKLVNNIHDCFESEILRFTLGYVFFQNRCALLFKDFMSTSSFQLNVTDMYVGGDTLYVSLSRKVNDVKTCDVSMRLYCVKIYGKLDGVKKIKYNLETTTRHCD